MKANLAARYVEPPLELGTPRPDRTIVTYKHLRRYEAEHEVTWLILDAAGREANVFDEEFFEELGRALDHLQDEWSAHAHASVSPTQTRGKKPKALVIRSAKASGFATGADLRMLERMKDEGTARGRIAAAHALIDRIEALDLTTIAVIHGHCLGGGLELALACDHRIARPDASFGFPEVRVGLHPGLGGTVRLPREVAPTEAMKLMLTGKPIDAAEARAIGLVDVVCEERHVANAVHTAAKDGLRRAGGDSRVALMSLAPARALIARQLETETEKRARREHYPAPFALIDLWRDEASGKIPDRLAAERASFLRLLATPTAQSLIRAFFLREHLKSLAGETGNTVRHVHVVGAGAMGADIAAWCALKGCTVTVEDTEKKRLGELCRRAAKLFEEKAKGAERKRAVDRLIPDFRSHGVGNADLVIEAVPEKVDVKREVFARLEPRMKANAILATNTSSIRLEPLGAGLARPGQFLGLHFFNPVEKMELVEVVEHDRSAADALATARAFVAAIDRLPAPVRSAPGFLANRALMPYLMEALVLMDEGHAPEHIDAAATAFGMPMGPLELADYVGLDICLDVAERLKSEVEEPLADIPGWVREKVERGELGKKSGRGIYEYHHEKPRKSTQRGAEKRPDETLQDILILPLLNACVTCLRSGVVSDERILDGAMIFATGFAPFRGGPLHYARSRGIESIAARLRELERERGPRFAPDAGWESFANTSAPVV